MGLPVLTAGAESYHVLDNCMIGTMAKISLLACLLLFLSTLTGEPTDDHISVTELKVCSRNSDGQTCFQ